MLCWSAVFGEELFLGDYDRGLNGKVRFLSVLILLLLLA